MSSRVQQKLLRGSLCCFLTFPKTLQSSVTVVKKRDSHLPREVLLILLGRVGPPTTTSVLLPGAFGTNRTLSSAKQSRNFAFLIKEQRRVSSCPLGTFSRLGRAFCTYGLWRRVFEFFLRRSYCPVAWDLLHTGLFTHDASLPP